MISYRKLIPCIYIAYTLNYKRKLYSVYEHFLAIGIIKTSLDYAYDEVKEWYVPRDSFNETFVTALYKQKRLFKRIAFSFIC